MAPRPKGRGAIPIYPSVIKETPVKLRTAVLAWTVATTLAIPCVAMATASSSAPQKQANQTSAAAVESDAESKTMGNVPSEKLLAWAKDAQCASCHDATAESFENKACLASTHAALDENCVTCHADDELIEIHADAKPNAKLPTKLKKSEVPAAACSTCHQPDALIKATSSSKVLEDADGTVVNPHDLPDIKDHEDLSCDSCHKMHKSSSPKNVANELCISCHHEDIYECYTCHA